MTTQKIAFVLKEDHSDAWSGYSRIIGVTLSRKTADAWFAGNYDYMKTRSWYEVPLVED